MYWRNYKGLTPVRHLDLMDCPQWCWKTVPTNWLNRSASSARTMKTGRLPQDWKQARITPIYKNGMRHKASNYRPISLTSQASKVIERIVKRYIMEHLDTNDLLSRHQHGFVPIKSWQSNLLETLEEGSVIIGQGLGLDIVYLHYQKSFDSVLDERLLDKVSGYGINGSHSGISSG